MKSLIILIFKIWLFILCLTIAIQLAPIIIVVLMASVLFGGTDRILKRIGMIFTSFKRVLLK